MISSRSTWPETKPPPTWTTSQKPDWLVGGPLPSYQTWPIRSSDRPHYLGLPPALRAWTSGGQPEATFDMPEMEKAVTGAALDPRRDLEPSVSTSANNPNVSRGSSSNDVQASTQRGSPKVTFDLPESWKVMAEAALDSTKDSTTPPPTSARSLHTPSISTRGSKGSSAQARGDKEDIFHFGVAGMKKQQALFHCSRGEHKELWYKFKRFETLSLLNLYYYQHELISLESKIWSTSGVMSSSDVSKMRSLLNKYYKAVQSFKEISCMPRPSDQERVDTVDKLTTVLGEQHYTRAADAYGLMDLTPQAFGVQPDPIRVAARAMTMVLKKREATKIRATRTEYLAGSRGPKNLAEEDEEANIGPNIEERKPEAAEKRIEISFAGRPYRVPITRSVDMVARVLMSVLAGAFLLAPTVALSYIDSRAYRLMTTAVFTFAFAVALSLLSEGRINELVTATAAYAAVLVVFVGASSGHSTT